MKSYIKKQIADSIEVKQALLDSEEIVQAIEDVAKKMIDVYRSGGKVLIAGNGGSAGDAQHMAGELINRFYFDRKGLPCIALTTDTSTMTAISNDYSFDIVFRKQIEANGNAGDMFFGISTSGGANNIMEAVAESREKGMVTVCMTGAKPCALHDACDYALKAPSQETPRIQECHILMIHMICAIVEREIFGEGF